LVTNNNLFLNIIIPILIITSFSIFAQISIDLEKEMERKVNKELNDATNEAIDIIPKVFEVPKDIDIK